MIIRPIAPTDHAEWHHLRGGKHWGGLCGFIEGSLRNYAEGCMTSPVAYIEGWYVDEESRGHRLGTRLVQAAEAWARRHGLKEIASDTQIENAVSIQAHTSLGYEEVERIVCFRKVLDAPGTLSAASSDASAPTTLQKATTGHAPRW